VLRNIHAIKQIRSSLSDFLNDSMSGGSQVTQSFLTNHSLNKEESQLPVNNFKSEQFENISQKLMIVIVVNLCKLKDAIFKTMPFSIYLS
jgi:hypothetical protein